MLDEIPDWYKDAIIYEVHVRAFFDSDGDGHGDFQGLTQKLDYLQDLGITAIWLLPFYPSPLKDDGYDIADYTSIHPQYGTLEDFQAFLEAAHERGLRVITELVLNHTSDQHPWFQRARLRTGGKPGTRFLRLERHSGKVQGRPGDLPGFRALELDVGPGRQGLLLAPVLFASARPQLRQSRPSGRRSFPSSISGWRWGSTGCGSTRCPTCTSARAPTARTCRRPISSSRRSREHVDARFPGRMFLAEANQWPEDAVAYFGKGDECHMAFHFPLMPRLFMALHQEDRFPIQDIMAQTPAIPENCQWCLFLRNHDELTLEMVTDEERDYMYRAYARDRHARINLGIRHRLAPLAAQRSPPHRADARPVVLAAGHAGHLLRRRDRHGRQHLPGRSQRRAHADAVVGRPQRRLQPGQSPEAVTCRSSSTRSITTRRSTSRPSRQTRPRSCGGSSG